MTKYFDFDNKENYGVQVCTSTTRPTAYDGRPIYETDTNKFLIYNLGTTTWEEISGGVTAHSSLSNLAWSVAGHTIDATIDMNSNKITELVDPTANQEAATKKYVDDNVGVSVHSSLSNLAWSVAGHTIDANIAMATNKITGLGAHTVNGDAVRFEHIALDEHTQYYNSARHTKAIHDTLGLAHSSLSNLAWSVAGHAIDADISPTSNNTTKLGSTSNAFSSIHVYNLDGYSSYAQIECLKNLDMNTHDIYNIAGAYFNVGATIYLKDDGSSNLDIILPVGKSLSLNSRKITEITDPTANQDAATKKYVDDNTGISDHGALTGLGDDDHAQYLNTARHDITTRHTLGTVVPHDAHSALSNLAWSVAGHTINSDISPTTNQTIHLGSASNAFNTIFVDSLSNFTTDAQIECLKNFDMNAHDIYNVDGLYLNSGATMYLKEDATGNMELHVATGKKIEIVVG